MLNPSAVALLLETLATPGHVVTWDDRRQAVETAKALRAARLVYRPAGHGFEVGFEGLPLARVVPHAKARAGLAALHRVLAAAGAPVPLADVTPAATPDAARLVLQRASEHLRPYCPDAAVAIRDGLTCGPGGAIWAQSRHEGRTLRVVTA